MNHQVAIAPEGAAAAPAQSSQTPTDTQAAQRGQSSEFNAAATDPRAAAEPPGSAVPPVAAISPDSFRLQGFDVGQAELLGAHRERLFCVANELNAEAVGVERRARMGKLFEELPGGGADITRPKLDADGNQISYYSGVDPQDHLRGWSRIESVTGSASPEGSPRFNTRLATARAENTIAALAGLSEGRAAGERWAAFNPDQQAGDPNRPATFPALRHAEVRVRPAIPAPGAKAQKDDAPTPPLKDPPNMSKVPTGKLEAVVPRNVVGQVLDRLPSKEAGVGADVAVEVIGELAGPALPLLWTAKGAVEMYSALNDAHLQDDLVVACRAFLWGFAAAASGLGRPPYPESWSGDERPEERVKLEGIWLKGLDAGAGEVTDEHRTFFRHPTPHDPAEGRKAAALAQLWAQVSTIPGAGSLVRDSEVIAWPGKLRG